VSSGVITWNAGAVLNRTRAQVVRGMTAASSYLATEAKRLVSRPNPEGDDPSKPGEPPKRVSGNLEMHVLAFNVEVDRSVVRGFFGVRDAEAVPYAMRLEFGFVGTDSLGRHINQEPRPFLRPTLLRNRAKIVAYLVKG